MSAFSDLMKGIRETIVLNDRVARLAEKVDQMDERQREQIERLVRVEAFMDFVKPAIARRGLPPAGG